MNRHTLVTTAGIILVSATCIGCVSVHRVTIQDAPRKTVTFESAKAMQLFNDTLLAERQPNERKPNRVRFGNTLYTREIRAASNFAFNESVAAADTDGNGAISEKEASAYSAFKAE